MIPYKQLSLADIFSDCHEKFENDKPAFLSLLETHIDIDELIPISFRNHFYASTGRTRKYPLQAFLWALIIQRIFSIPTDQLLLTFLAYSKPLREFCGFTKVPDASKITRFKQDFLDDLQFVFDKLVDVTEPICQAIDSAKADMTIFDSSGIEAFVTENNPKYANRIIKQLKAHAKAHDFDKSYDPYKAAYGSMPSHASANPEIKQLYMAMNQSCYALKGKNDFPALFVFSFTRYVIATMKKKASGAVFSALVTRDFEMEKVFEPNFEDAILFEKRVEPLFAQILANTNEIQQLLDLQNALLTQLSSR